MFVSASFNHRLELCCTSASTRATFRSSAFSQQARCTAMVDLPTPPLTLIVTTITSLFYQKRIKFANFFVSWHKRVPLTDRPLEWRKTAKKRHYTNVA